ncbi:MULTISPECIES: RNA polymerase factor sigma-54 [unclassified Rhodanobacter]|uniref:RNA polymerase factor sigma-54 n=1 Tax=unclassified Rhodanobacter TaxID=2621553 RepID=UPI001BDFC3B5|nr:MULTISPECIES: RNA polymerase factor sigma-54 [unclassified Rhodanobacter]MBT2145374.1 RNA polymerase factor sigma-54 [Rhodanobacter sp. LX-99]MBT2149419.1 RNA polymerase factor sigma-54 [Rhodanobacter sp. LX-100]
MKPALQFRLHQQLTLTPQLQQAIRLLQLSQLELEAELRQIAESNPLLEFAEEVEDDEATESVEAESEYPSVEAVAASSSDDGDAGDWSDGGGVAETPIDFSSNSGGNGSSGSRGDDDFEPQNAAPETLQQHLLWQLNLASFNPRQHLIATVLIDALNPAGYLGEGLEAVLAALPADFNASVEEVEAVRRRLQGFDPTGVGSLDLRDCLRVQLEQFDPDTPQRDLALRIVDAELDLLARNDIARLARRLRASEDDVAAAAVLIRSLDPRPGAALDATPVEYVAPDVYALRDGSRWRVSLNPDAQPRLGLNQHYCGLIAQARGEDASWMRGQLQEARWLIKSLESRAETLLKVAEAIVRRQSAFLDYGPEAMHPLVLREVAEEVGMHESTISRVTTRKYMHTPRGTFELKYFFSSGVSTEDGGSASATAIQAMLRKLIESEDVRKPLSDLAIAEELQRKGIQVARRTVAKYREGLRIPTSSERQRAG